VFFSSKCSLFHNSNVFGSCFIHILYTGCAKFKKNNSGAKWLIIRLLYASTCFEHYVLIIRSSKLPYTASGIITHVGGRPVHRLREEWRTPLSTCTPDGHLQVWWYQMLYNTIWPPDDEHIVLETCRGVLKFSRYRPGVAQRVGSGIALLFHDRGTRRGWVVSSTPVSGQQHVPAALYLLERHGTHFTGGWVGPRVGLDGQKISPPTGFDPRPSSP